MGVRWRRKPPALSAITQEPKMNDAPYSNATVDLTDIIGYSRGSSINTPTWRASWCYFTGNLLRDTSRSSICRQGVAKIRNSMVHTTQCLERFRPPNSLIPYVMFGGLYCVSCWYVSEGSLPGLISLGRATGRVSRCF